MATPVSPSQTLLSPTLRTVLTLAGALDIVLGALFFTGPETGISLWPTPVPALLSRFIGAIILASGAGVLAMARQGTWEGARAMFWLGLTYSVASLLALLYHLLLLGAPPAFWLYAALDVVYLVPIAYVLATYERKRR